MSYVRRDVVTKIHIRNTKKQICVSLDRFGYLIRLGINWKKSASQPRQQVEYLGVMLALVKLQAVLSEPRWTTLQQAVLRLWQGVAVTDLSVMQALGLMAAGHPVVLLGLLHMRCLQRWFASLLLDPKRHKHHLVNLLV